MEGGDFGPYLVMYSGGDIYGEVKQRSRHNTSHPFQRQRSKNDRCTHFKATGTETPNQSSSNTK